MLHNYYLLESENDEQTIILIKIFKTNKLANYNLEIY